MASGSDTRSTTTPEADEPRANARLDHQACYQAISRRDRRFDGHFYTAVLTTGIFCRPSCPARTPASKNVRFFAHAGGAVDAGFRPCRRCRPELAPAHPEWNRRADLANRALALIEQGVVDQDGVGGLAARLGVSERHLRRELISEVGTGPQQLARTRRLWLARALLDQTSLSVTDIAFASGFSSIRQFNDSFRQAFAATPTELRRRPGRAKSEPQAVRLVIASRGRLGWGRLSSFLEARAIPGLESFAENRFRRNLPGGWVELGPTADDHALEVTCHLDEVGDLAHLVPILRTVCDVDADLAAITERLSADSELAGLLAQQRETTVPRLPGTFDRFEVAVRAVIGQQVSVAAARTTLGKLLDLVNPHTGGRHQRFCTPGELLEAPLDQLGVPGTRRATLASLAAAVDSGQIELSPEADPADVEARLLAIKGIGPWTAGYIVMRAFGHPDGWPAGDLVLARRLGISGHQLQSRADAWRPWRAYAAMTIWSATPIEPTQPTVLDVPFLDVKESRC